MGNRETLTITAVSILKSLPGFLIHLSHPRDKDMYKQKMRRVSLNLRL